MFLDVVQTNAWISAGGMLGAAAVGAFAIIKSVQEFIKDAKEKRQQKIDADLERERIRANAEIEKEKLRTEAEVQKVKEKGISGEAVVKIWKEVDELKGNISILNECKSEDHTNDVLIKEIVTKMKEELKRITDWVFNNFGSNNFLNRIT